MEIELGGGGFQSFYKEWNLFLKETLFICLSLFKCNIGVVQHLEGAFSQGSGLQCPLCLSFLN